jgi:hypothetical protein
LFHLVLADLSDGSAHLRRHARRKLRIAALRIYPDDPVGGSREASLQFNAAFYITQLIPVHAPLARFHLHDSPDQLPMSKCSTKANTAIPNATATIGSSTSTIASTPLTRPSDISRSRERQDANGMGRDRSVWRPAFLAPYPPQQHRDHDRDEDESAYHGQRQPAISTPEKAPSR